MYTLELTAEEMDTLRSAPAYPQLRRLQGTGKRIRKAD